ncbi:unnamed protein product [Sympodiomycopsis kandeliae]
MNKHINEVSRSDRGRGGRSSPYSRSGPSKSASDDNWKHDLFEGHSNGGRYTKSDTPTPKLLIEGLHYEVSEDELRSLFSQIGPVQKSFIKFDRSGRSTGVAIVIYQNADDAAAARQEFDGANAKGKPITISFEHMRQPRGDPHGGPGDRSKPRDLRSRMDLLSRLGAESPKPPSNAPKGPASTSSSSDRTPKQQGSNRQARGVGGSEGNGRRGGRGGRSNGRSKTEARGPKSASDLDAELEAFMKAPASTNAMAESVHAPQPGVDGDVEMQ